jgi:glycosyltransferase involved in cell wall biosynthesis
MHRNPIILAKELGKFATWLRRNQISVVHVHHRRLAALCCLFKGLLGCRVVYTGQVTYPFASWFWTVRPDVATAVSGSVARNMRDTMRVQDVRVICNPVDFSKTDLTIVSEEVVVDAVCVGRLEPVKGHQYLIQAWAKLRDQGIRAKLSLVGEGYLKAHLQSQVNEIGLEDLIEFRGFRSDVKAEVLRGRFAILASRVEGQALAVIEAAACGRASLLTNVDGSMDCLPPNRTLPNGVPFADAETLAAALKVWLSSRDLVKQEGQTFHKYLAQMSSSEIVGAQYAKIYREVGLETRPR